LEESTVDTSEQSLYDELCDLVDRKPKNLLQALKALVSKHTREQSWKSTEPRASPRTVVLRQPPKAQPASQVSAADEGWQTVTYKKSPATANGSAWHFRKDDWQPAKGKMIGFPVDASHLGSSLDECSGLSWVMCTNQPDEAENAIDMIQGAVSDKDDHSLTLIFDGRFSQLGTWAESAKLMRVPGTCNGRLQLKKVWVVECGPHPATLRTRAETPLVVTKPPRSPADQRVNSYVLRVSIDWYYTPAAWEEVQRRPAQSFRAWALSHGVKPFSIMDSWDFQQCGTHRISGLVRVSALADAQKLFHQSGITLDPTQHRWFCDVLGNKSTFSSASKVCWLPWKESESYDAYLQRVICEASNGLALGDKQLGIKISPQDARWTAPLCHWRLRGAPPHWHAPDIESLAQELGFKDIEITQKARVRHGAAWVFRAQRLDDLNVLQQVVDWEGDGQIGEVEVIKEATRRSQKITTNLQQERVVDFSFTQLKRNQGRLEKRPLHCTPIEKKRPHIPEEDQEDSAMGNTAWMPTGRVVSNAADGNCLWYALAEKASTAEKKRSHRQMRAWTVSLMKQNAELETLWINQLRPDSRGKPSQLTWQDYLSEQNTVQTWSGAFEAAICCEGLGYRLWICTDDGHLHLLNPEGANDFVCLKYHCAGHYELIQEVNETELQERLKFLNEKGSKPKDTQMRGGVVRPGLSDFASSRATLKTCKSKSVVKPKAARSGKRVTPALTDFASGSSRHRPTTHRQVCIPSRSFRTADTKVTDLPD
jgi:hypothetical protein